MNKYHKECWFWHSDSVVQKDSYYQCTKCGATYTDTQIIGLAELEPGNVFDPFGGKPRGRRAKHPTPAVQRRAARARLT